MSWDRHRTSIAIRTNEPMTRILLLMLKLSETNLFTLATSSATPARHFIHLYLCMAEEPISTVSIYQAHNCDTILKKALYSIFSINNDKRLSK